MMIKRTTLIVLALLITTTTLVLVQAQQYHQPAYNPEYNPNVDYNTQNSHKPTDMIHMSEIKALTLHEDKLTTSRRGQPVPQMKCIGGDAMNSGYRPFAVQCKNMGYDGISQQWKCEATMSDHVRFGKVLVNCEGYSGPGDANVLKGSCALDYELWYTEKGKEFLRDNQRSTYQYNMNRGHERPNVMNPPRSQPIYQEQSDSGIGSVMIIVVFLVILFVFAAMCSKSSNSTHTANAAPYTASPPYNPNVYPSVPRSADHTYSSHSGSGISNTTAFLSGVATGATAGYMTGRATSSSSSRSTYTDDGYYAPRYTASNSNSTTRNDRSSGEHTSKGYGGSASR